MIKESERAFIHQLSVGDLGRCEEMLKIADSTLQVLYYEEKTIRGYRYHLVKDQEHLESVFINWFDYYSVTSGNYPFLYVAIQPFDEKPQSFKDLMEPLGYVSCTRKPIGEDVLSSPENKKMRAYIRQKIQEHKRKKVLEDSNDK